MLALTWSASQKLNRKTPSMMRGSPAEIACPKLAAPNWVEILVIFGWLKALKASTRSCAPTRSVIGNVLPAELKSDFARPYDGSVACIAEEAVCRLGEDTGWIGEVVVLSQAHLAAPGGADLLQLVRSGGEACVSIGIAWSKCIAALYYRQAGKAPAREKLAHQEMIRVPEVGQIVNRRSGEDMSAIEVGPPILGSHIARILEGAYES